MSGLFTHVSTRNFHKSRKRRIFRQPLVASVLQESRTGEVRMNNPDASTHS